MTNRYLIMEHIALEAHARGEITDEELEQVVLETDVNYREKD